MTRVFHIVAEDAWNAPGYRPASLDGEGFIHCSTGAQVAFAANRFYHGRQDLVLLHVDPRRLTSPLKYEAAEPGMPPFPHLYGPLDLAAVLAAPPFLPDPTGRFNFP